MRRLIRFVLVGISVGLLTGAEAALPRSADPQQKLERTCFQTGLPWSALANLGSDVAIVYGIGPDFPQRMNTWLNRGYRTHLMTGVAWGAYQDYISGLFDGRKHQ